eukprot:640827-Prymnesium_polylepis.2
MWAASFVETPKKEGSKRKGRSTLARRETVFACLSSSKSQLWNGEAATVSAPALIAPKNLASLSQRTGHVPDEPASSSSTSCSFSGLLHGTCFGGDASIVFSTSARTVPCVTTAFGASFKFSNADAREAKSGSMYESIPAAIRGVSASIDDSLPSIIKLAAT